MENQDLEQKLLDILGSSEVSAASDLAEAENAVQNAFPHLDEKARKAMARVMTCEMPSPEEIARAEQLAKVNAAVRARREVDLKRRAERRMLKGKSRKNRKRKK